MCLNKELGADWSLQRISQVSMVPRHLEWMVQWYSHLPVWMHSWLRWRSSCQCSHAAPPSAKALMPLAQCPSVQ
ncbi:uncharacterized protein LOC142592783 isoform X3 [Dermacentor variabilis]|uniref:uncharacterized protein LOC142592783 isoform X3 n=1 Tax=Dermacentor variabilis TaxID=34621 RepID=UPI003F5B4F7F